MLDRGNGGSSVFRGDDAIADRCYGSLEADSDQLRDICADDGSGTLTVHPIAGPGTRSSVKGLIMKVTNPGLWSLGQKLRWLVIVPPSLAVLLLTALVLDFVSRNELERQAKQMAQASRRHLCAPPPAPCARRG